jgi:hypothetical protein
MRRVLWAVAIGAIVAATIGAAPPKIAPKPATPAARPDFSGRWELDLARTDFGPQKTKPRARVDVIRHRDPSLTVETMTVRSDGDTVRYPWRFMTDGTETKNKLMGQDVTSIGGWRADTLTFDSSAQVMMAEFRTVDRWRLSPDRSILTIHRHSDSPMGKSDQRFVFVRRK